jgi:formylglycine-generating enzyme required for sulfatase activity
MEPFSIAIGDTEITFLPIAAGDFAMGSSREEIAHAIEEFPHLDKAWFDKEYPQHDVNVADFYMAETLVTNAQWKTFMLANDIANMPRGFHAELPDHPVWGITFEELEKFCVWLSEISGKSISIPTEEQWEKAARGEDEREYP